MATSISTIIGTNIPNGPQGATGAQGTTGTAIQGTTGTATQGTTGSQGVIGTSVQGAAGAAQGTTGAQGVIGVQGVIGAGTQGATGTQGALGTATQGAVGAGTQGATGTTGTQGITGTQGVNGLNGAGSPGGLDTYVQYNGTGNFTGDSNLRYISSATKLLVGSTTTNTEIGIGNTIYFGSNTYITLPYNPSPPNPDANASILHTQNVAGRMMLGVSAPDQDYTFQPHFGKNRVYQWMANGMNQNVQVTPNFSSNTLTQGPNGTLTARPWAATNLLTRATRVGYVSTTTTGQIVGWRLAGHAIYSLGTANNTGGFTFVSRFGVSDPAAVATARMFVGMISSLAAPTNVEPSTLTNCAGFAEISSDKTQWYFVYGGSVAQTAVALGTNLGSPQNTATIWEASVFSPPNKNGEIGYQMTNIATGNTARGYIVPTTPGTTTSANSTNLVWSMWRTNNGTGAVVGLDFISTYIEVDQ